MVEIHIPRRDDDESDRKLIAMHIPQWVRDLTKSGNQITAVFDDDERCRWLINRG